MLCTGHVFPAGDFLRGGLQAELSKMLPTVWRCRYPMSDAVHERAANLPRPVRNVVHRMRAGRGMSLVEQLPRGPQRLGAHWEPSAHLACPASRRIEDVA